MEDNDAALYRIIAMMLLHTGKQEVFYSKSDFLENEEKYVGYALVIEGSDKGVNIRLDIDRGQGNHATKPH